MCGLREGAVEDHVINDYEISGKSVTVYSLHISGNYVPIIRRNNCIYATLGICYCVWMTGMLGGIPDSHPHRVTNTKCRIDTVISRDDGHIVARNM